MSFFAASALYSMWRISQNSSLFSSSTPFNMLLDAASIASTNAFDLAARWDPLAEIEPVPID